MVGCVPGEESVDILIFRLKPLCHRHGIFDVIVPRVDDSVVRKRQQVFDGMIKPFQISGKAIPHGTVKERIAGYQKIVHVEGHRIGGVSGCMVDGDGAVRQYDRFFFPNRLIIQKGGTRCFQKPTGADGMIAV